MTTVSLKSKDGLEILDIDHIPKYKVGDIFVWYKPWTPQYFLVHQVGRLGGELGFYRYYCMNINTGEYKYFNRYVEDESTLEA